MTTRCSVVRSWRAGASRSIERAGGEIAACDFDSVDEDEIAGPGGQGVAGTRGRRAEPRLLQQLLPHLAVRVLVRRDVDDRQLERHRRLNDLAELPFGFAEGRAQGLVALDQAIRAALQRALVLATPGMANQAANEIAARHGPTGRGLAGPTTLTARTRIGDDWSALAQFPAVHR